MTLPRKRQYFVFQDLDCTRKASERETITPLCYTPRPELERVWTNSLDVEFFFDLQSRIDINL